MAGLRGDEVAPEILGMNQLLSDESLRHALAHLAPHPPKNGSDEERAARTAQRARSTGWMGTALSESRREALRTHWILDTDCSVKVLYGHQAGSEMGYNPSKPGRPSHTLLHSDWIGKLRLVLDGERQGGKAHAAKHRLPRLRLLIERLWRRGDWQRVSQGFDAVEGARQLKSSPPDRKRAPLSPWALPVWLLQRANRGI